jgi:hypothetical protein
VDFFACPYSIIYALDVSFVENFGNSALAFSLKHKRLEYPSNHGDLLWRSWDDHDAISEYVFNLARFEFTFWDTLVT